MTKPNLISVSPTRLSNFGKHSLSIGENWPGWATVESEPAIFDQLLKKIGVKGISVEEIYSLDPDSLHALDPIYGMIFLFRWKEEQEKNQPEMVCPDDIWFANQVIDNACASLALLNIVFNIEGEKVEIGEHLTSFKDFTKDFTPPLRGITLTNFDYLRILHNTFARKSEMAYSDLALMENMALKNKRGYVDDVDDDADDCFHFVAYIYKRGHLWELDGLKKAPVRLDKCTRHDWTSFAAPQIQERMDSAGEIRFNLLALCQDPVIVLKERLDMAQADLELEDDPTLVMKLKAEIESIRTDLAERDAREDSYQEYAARRRHDYGDFCKQMLIYLNEKGVLQQMIE